jgi:hypothetical protein
MQAVCLAFDLALDSAGRSMAARIAMIAMTTSNSIKVNADLGRDRKQINFIKAKMSLKIF